MSANTEPIARFRLGRIVATPNALNHIPNDDILCAIQRHQSGEWGEVDDHDRQANDCAVAHGGRLVSVYYSVARVKFWLITEADRSVTTVLLPEDY